MNIDLRVTVPVVYIDPISMLNPLGEADLRFLPVIKDLWENYRLNIRYLHVVSDLAYVGIAEGTAVLNNFEQLPKQFKTEVIAESKLLEFLRPSHVVCFFGLRDILPSNYKVYGFEELLSGGYKTILAGKESSTPSTNNRPRRQAKRREGYL